MRFTVLTQNGHKLCAISLILFQVVSTPILANSDVPQFKRIIVGEETPGNRINIQIQPQPDVPAPETGPEENETGVETQPPVILEDGAGRADWFWRNYAPDLEYASVLSLQKAVNIDAPEAQALTPSLEAMQNLVTLYGRDLLRAGAREGVSPALLLSIMYVESRGKPDAVSPAGAVGVMQLIPGTADRFGVKDATDPAQAIEGAAKYVKFLLEEFGGDAILALAGYNAGENAVLNHGGVPPYAETRDYIPKVVAAWRIARMLCTGPQDYATDGCVFSSMG